MYLKTIIMYVKICSWLFWALKFISLRSFSHAKFQDLTMGYHMITTYKGWCKAFLMVYKTNGVLLFSRRKIEQPTNHAACCNVFFYNFSTARNLLEKQLPHRYSMNERHDRQKKAAVFKPNNYNGLDNHPSSLEMFDGQNNKIFQTYVCH